MSVSTNIAVGVTLVVFSFIIIGVLIFFIIRRNRTPHADQEMSANANTKHKRVGSVVLDKSHPAARAVTPFSGVVGLGGEAGPRFNHKPGEAMRVAHRRSDGGWSFSGPLTLNPRQLPGLAPPSSYLTSPSRHHLMSPSTDSLSSASPHPPALSVDGHTNYSPTSTIFTFTPASARGTRTDKEKKMAPGELTTRGFVELDLEGDMPPAYSYKVADEEDEREDEESSVGHGSRHEISQ